MNRKQIYQNKTSKQAKNKGSKILNFVNSDEIIAFD